MEELSQVSDILHPVGTLNESANQSHFENQPAEESLHQPVTENQLLEESLCQPAPENQSAEESLHQPAPDNQSAEESFHQPAPDNQPAEESLHQPATDNQPAEDSLHQPATDNQPAEESLHQPAEESLSQSTLENKPAEKSLRQPVPENPSVQITIGTDNAQDGRLEPCLLHRFRTYLQSRIRQHFETQPRREQNEEQPREQNVVQVPNEDSSCLPSCRKMLECSRRPQSGNKASERDIEPVNPLNVDQETSEESGCLPRCGKWLESRRRASPQDQTSSQSQERAPRINEGASSQSSSRSGVPGAPKANLSSSRTTDEIHSDPASEVLRSVRLSEQPETGTSTRCSKVKYFQFCRRFVKRHPVIVLIAGAGAVATSALAYLYTTSRRTEVLITAIFVPCFITAAGLSLCIAMRCRTYGERKRIEKETAEAIRQSINTRSQRHARHESSPTEFDQEIVLVTESSSPSRSQSTSRDVQGEALSTDPAGTSPDITSASSSVPTEQASETTNQPAKNDQKDKIRSKTSFSCC